MENASKALIIAGAILLSILLISVGIMVLNTINNPVERAKNQSDAQAIEMFNAQFTPYAGDQTASSVKSLLTAVQSNNGVNSMHKVVAIMTTDTGAGTIEGIGRIQSRLSSQKKYNIEFTYGSTVTHPGYTETNRYVYCECQPGDDGAVHAGYIVRVNIKEL